MTDEQMQRHLRRANEVAREAAAKGRHPFGAVLVAPDFETVLLTHGNVDTVNHAEAVLARVAAHRFDAAYRSGLAGPTSATDAEDRHQSRPPLGLCLNRQFSFTREEP